MRNSENPYTPPSGFELLSRKWKVNWKLFVVLNVAIALAVAVLVLTSIAWANYSETQLHQELGRRYASYDREYVFYPLNGLIMLAAIFAIPNIVFFIVQSWRQVPPDSN